MVRRSPPSTDRCGSSRSRCAGRDKDINEARKDLGLDIKVTFNVAHTETFAKLNAGVLSPQQDLLHIQQPFVRPLAQRKWILPIDPTQLKNHSRMFAQFKNPEWAQLDGKIVRGALLSGATTRSSTTPSTCRTAARAGVGCGTTATRAASRSATTPSRAFQPVALFLGYNPNQYDQGAARGLQEVPDLEEGPLPPALGHLRRSGQPAAQRGGVGAVGLAPHGDRTAQGRDGHPLRFAEGEGHRLVRERMSSPRTPRYCPSVYAFLDWVLDEKFATSMAKDFGYRMTTRRT